MSKNRWSKKNQKYTLDTDIVKSLRGKYEAGKGRSRHEDKKTGADKDYVYSSRTYSTYVAAGMAFAKWLKKTHPDVKHLKNARRYCNEWLQAMVDENRSPWTITTRKSALAKIFDMDYADFIETPSRHRADIVRGRVESDYSKRISRKNLEYYGTAGMVIGYRRAEMLRAVGTDLKRDAEGNWYVDVTRGTKGGKARKAYLCGTDEEIAKVVEIFRKAGENKCFPRIPTTLVEHAWRRKYAQRMYEKYARPVSEIPPEDRYVCRAEKAGVVLDKRAMRIVSVNMGHSRIDVIASNYLFD